MPQRRLHNRSLCTRCSAAGRRRRFPDRPVVRGRRARRRFADSTRRRAARLAARSPPRSSPRTPFDLFVTPIVDRAGRPRVSRWSAPASWRTFGPDLARKLATVGALAARQRRVESLAFAMRPGLADAAGDIDLAGFAQAIAEGLTLGEFNAGSYKTADPAPGSAAALHDRAARRARHVARKPGAARGRRSRAAACSASAAISRASSRTSPATR